MLVPPLSFRSSSTSTATALLSIYGTCARFSTTFFDGERCNSPSSAERSSGCLFRSISPAMEATSASPSLRAAGTSLVLVFNASLMGSLSLAGFFCTLLFAADAEAGHRQQHPVGLLLELYV